MRPTKPIVRPADDGDGGPGRTFVKGRYTATRYQRRSAALPRLSGEERSGPLPSADPTVDSPWSKYEARPAPPGGIEPPAPPDEVVVDLREPAATSPFPPGMDRRTWYQRHSAGLPRITEGDDAEGAPPG